MDKKLNLPEGWEVSELVDEFELYSYWEVQKWVNNDKLPVKAMLMRLNYSALEDDKWSINSLENSFEDLTAIFAKNLNFLPEPLYFDFIELEEIKEPVLIYRPIIGQKLKIDWSYNDDTVCEYILYIIEKVAHLIRRLHEKDIIIRSLSKNDITIRSGGYYFSEFASFVDKNNYLGYNPSKKTLEPQKIHSAPECFDSQASLTTETDIYVFGKFILQLLMDEQDYNDLFEPNPFPEKREYESLIKKIAISDEIKSLLVGTLARDRDYRFYDMYELINKIQNIKSYGRSGLKGYYCKSDNS